MLESAEVGHRVAKTVYARAEPKLREALLNHQFELSAGNRGPVLLLVSGVEGGGRGETANKLNEWMDPRHIRTHAFGPRTPDELGRPLAWRFWRALPPRGKVGIFMNAWYRELVRARVLGRLSEPQFNDLLHEVRQHEQMLTNEGIVLLKFWIHLSRDDQKDRLRALERDPRTRGRLTSEDSKLLRNYGKLHDAWEHMLRETSIAAAPWYVIEGKDERYRMLTIGKILLGAMEKVNSGARPVPVAAVAPPPAVIGNVALIRRLDLSQRIDDKAYDRDLAKHQGRIAMLTTSRRFRDRALVIAFEGSDAAGKGGAIRRVTGALDARQYLVVPVAAPTEEERAQPYLWRFWRHVPANGCITIFDRTWYGRVLVERVEGYCSTADWMRAYEEINHFEDQLARTGIIVCKFWLQVSKAEQLKRFRLRANTSFKKFKITAEDWRNRKKWNAYEQAVADMVDRTSTEIAPWTLIEAEDKRFGRVKVVRTIAETLERALG
ncbi:MAG: polyphosphate:AMP phosphotransferase [Burkholderiales bacterium]